MQPFGVGQSLFGKGAHSWLFLFLNRHHCRSFFLRFLANLCRSIKRFPGRVENTVAKGAMKDDVRALLSCSRRNWGSIYRSLTLEGEKES